MPPSEKEQGQIEIHWDLGTAYDFFISAFVLKEPKRFGVRSSWASGMRARLQTEDREILDASLMVLDVPAEWILSLPQPKNVESCLMALAQIPAKERLARLAGRSMNNGEYVQEQQLLQSVSLKGSWSGDDLAQFRELRISQTKARAHVPDAEDLMLILGAWAEAEAFGEQYLHALRSYYDVFFKEEERRIASKLKLALEHAQLRAKALSSVDLIEEISQGIRYDEMPNIKELTLVPSYWIDPLVKIHRIGETHRLWVFGARPAEDSLVPGDPIPDALRTSLKALADPTRLRILRYLKQEPLPLAELAKRLRLRIPTVTHHILALRLAGLVLIHVQSADKGARRKFSVRSDGLEETVQSLKAFLEVDRESI